MGASDSDHAHPDLMLKATEVCGGQTDLKRLLNLIG